MPTYRLNSRSKITFIYDGDPVEFEADDEDLAYDYIQEYILDYGKVYSWDVNYEELDEDD